YYLDSTPTHSYMKWLYKYPQRAYPYEDVVKTNHARSRNELEYELIDTGIFDDDRYFDVVVEYAKATPCEILVKISVVNRGPDAATLHLLPTLWFRRTWSAGEHDSRPRLEVATAAPGTSAVAASHHDLGARWLLCEGDVALLFTENATNAAKLFGGGNEEPFVKDGINDHVVLGRSDAVNPARTGTKAAAHYRLEIPGAETRVVRLRLTDVAPDSSASFGPSFDETIATRQREADAFYDAISPPSLSTDERAVMRQALAGMLWSKQYYFFDLDAWLEGH